MADQVGILVGELTVVVTCEEFGGFGLPQYLNLACLPQYLRPMGDSQGMALNN